MRITADELTDVATSILSHAGASRDVAAKVATRLVHANLTGHDSHGVGMVPAYVEGIQAGQLIPDAKINVVKDKGPFLLVDGQQGFGHMIAVPRAVTLPCFRCATVSIWVAWGTGAQWRPTPGSSAFYMPTCSRLGHWLLLSGGATRDL